MLHMRFNSNGKVVYAFQPRTVNGISDEVMCGTIMHPVITPNTKKKIRINDWYAKNACNIRAVVTMYMDALQYYLTRNPQYICFTKIKQLESNIICMLHQCSHNSFKNYPSL